MRHTNEPLADRLARWLAYRLPARVCYWAYIRVGARVTTEPPLDTKNVPEVTMMEALQQFGRRFNRQAGASLVLALALLVAGGCKRHREPGPDTTAVDTAGRPDTAARADQPWVNDYTGADAKEAPDAPLPPPRPRLRGASNTGLAFGLYNYPESQWCNAGPFNAITTAVSPDRLVKELERARLCGFRYTFAPPRASITTNGRAPGPFDMGKAKAISAQYARVLTPTVRQKYADVLIAMKLADDYGSTDAWDGHIVTQAQIAEWGRYTKQLMPWLPLLIRVEPWWATDEVAATVDVAVSQYRIKKGDLDRYIARSMTEAQRRGLKLVFGINVGNCIEASTSRPCTADEIRTFGEKMLRADYRCGFESWRYDSDFESRRPAWDYLASIAKGMPKVSCAR